MKRCEKRGERRRGPHGVITFKFIGASTLSNWTKLIALFIGLSVASVAAHAQDAFVQGLKSAGKIKVTSCVVSSVQNKSIKHDCTSTASSQCNGLESCELPIGYNLTDGKDIDPSGVPMVGRLGKLVDIEYLCGTLKEKRGPNPQNNNATLILSCS